MTWGHRRRARRQRGLDAALDAAGALWPHGARATISWRPGPGRHGLRAVPSLARPSFLVSSGAASSVPLRPTAGVRGLPMRAARASQRRGMGPWMPGSVVRVDRAAGRPAGIEALLEAVLQQRVTDVAVLLDRSPKRRRVMLWAMGADGRPLGVVKMSREAFDRPSLEREYEALSATGPAVPGLRRPEALAYVRWNGHDVLVVSALTTAAASTQACAPVAQMRALASAAGSEQQPLAETPFVAHLSAVVDALRPDIGGLWGSHALEGLVARHGSVLVTPGPCHGDWTWWNMARDGDVVLLWDWEHFSETAVQGFDHLHFLALEQRRIAGSRESEDVWVGRARSALATSWGCSPSQQDAVIAAYLLDINVRYYADRQHLGPEVSPRGDWGPALLERCGSEVDPGGSR